MEGRPARKPGILWVELGGWMTVEEMTAFVAAHNAAIDDLGGREFKVFCDIRNLTTLLPDCADLLQAAKNYSSSQPNFRGSAVWVASNVLATMQHRRTSEESGVLDTELIDADAGVLWAHLDQVYRT